MKTEELIQQLSCQCSGKFTRPMCTWRCGLSWVIFCSVYLYFIIGHYGLRLDIHMVLDKPLFVSEIIISMLLGISAALSASWLSTPDGKQQKWMYWLPFIPLLGLAAILLARFGFESTPTIPAAGYIKPLVVSHIIFVVLPLIFFFVILKRAATTRPAWTSGMACLAIAAFAYIGLRLVIPTDSAQQILLLLVAPQLALWLISRPLGARLLRW